MTASIVPLANFTMITDAITKVALAPPSCLYQNYASVSLANTDALSVVLPNSATFARLGSNTIGDGATINALENSLQFPIDITNN